MSININWDKAGITASVLCAIHCAVLPLLPTGISLLGVSITDNIWFEWGMILLTLVIGLYSLIHGFITHHKNYRPIIFFGIGFLLLVMKQIFHDYHLVFLVFAVAAIIYAHFANFRLCRQTKCSSVHHKH